MRLAMSMIELVISIVVMGIVVMSLPLILTQVQNNNAFALQQEAILAAKTKIGNILTYEWDEFSYDATAGHSFVLDIAGGTDDLNRSAGTNQRKGHVNVEGRRKLYDNTLDLNVRSASAINNNKTNTIDAFHARNVNLSVAPNGEEAGALSYIFNLRLDPTIVYVNDNINYDNSNLTFTLTPDNAGIITNIKRIEVQVRDTDANALITTLRAFTCNIGESPSLPSRPYQ